MGERLPPSSENNNGNGLPLVTGVTVSISGSAAASGHRCLCDESQR